MPLRATKSGSVLTSEIPLYLADLHLCVGHSADHLQRGLVRGFMVCPVQEDVCHLLFHQCCLELVLSLQGTPWKSSAFTC